jgi:lipase chaperone LimK
MNVTAASPPLRRAAWAALACLLAAGVAWLAWPDTGGDEVPAGTAAQAGTHPVETPAVGRTAPPPPTAGAEPVDPSRMFDLGAAGDLRIDLETKAALDMIVAELGANPTPAALAELERSLRSGLPREAAGQVLTLVQSYHAYSQALARSATSQKPPQNPEEMRLLLEQDAALRRQHFDPASAKALFGVQDAYSRYALDAQAIESSTTLGAVEKARQLHALRSALPPEVLDLEPSLSPTESEMNLRIAQLREQGGTDAEVLAVRTQYLGAEAASSIGESESQNAAWAKRHQAFRQARAALLATSPADPQAALEKLLAQHFSADELPGARAYDQQQGR